VGQGRLPGGEKALALHDPHRLGRSGAVQEILLPGRPGGAVVSGRGRGGAGCQDRLLHHHGPYRRRAERLRPPYGHHGNRIGPGGQSPGGGSRRGGPSRRPDRGSHLRLRGAQGAPPLRGRCQEGDQGAPGLGGPGNRPHRQAQGHPLWGKPAQDPLR